MKKLEILKTIQLFIYIILAILAAISLVLSDELYHMIVANKAVHTMFLFLWAIFAISFVFMLIDFIFSAKLKKDYRELNYAVHSDPLSGLSNRNGCDALIDKYLDKELPENIGCIMFELANIGAINQSYGHRAGNQAIQEYAEILSLASAGKCFVGRNGGNKFLAIFEDGSIDLFKDFLFDIRNRVNDHNDASPKTPIEYKYGIAFQEKKGVKNITDLVALSNRRINKEN